MLTALGVGIALILAYALYSSRRTNYGYSYNEVTEAHKYHLSGNEKHRQQDIEGAMEDYDKGLKIAPRYVPLLMARANVYMEIEEFDSALRDYSLCIGIEPNHYEAHCHRAEAYEKIGKLGEALSDYSFLIDKFDDCDAYIGRYEIYLRLKQFDKALSDAEIIVGDAQESWVKNAYYGEIYFRKGDYDKAIEAMTAVLNGDTNDHDNRYKALTIRSISYSQTHQYENAINDYTKLVELDENDAFPYNSRSWAKAAAGDYQGALEDANKAIELESGHAYIYSTRGQAYWLLGDYQSALADFEHAQQLEPEHISYLAEMAVAEFALQRNEAAIQLWLQLQAKSDKSVMADKLQTENGWAQPFYEAMQQVEALAKSK